MATTKTPTIVNLNTVVTQAPVPSQLQQSGAAVSTGGTTLTTGTEQYCSNLSAVVSILAAPLALSSLAWASGVVTATASATLEMATGQMFTTIISGATPAAYNGTYAATVTGASTFTYALVANPGTETVAGSYSPPDSGFLIDAATTFFAQGNQIGLYVLELGPQVTAAASIAALQTWITANASPQPFYAYLVPGAWDALSAAALNSMTANYDSPTGMTYFFITTTTSNVTLYAGNKAAFTTVPSPTQATSEHQASVPFYNWLVNNPGPANQLAPMAFRFAFGVTPWVQKGNGTPINAVLTANGNLLLTGAEGGLSNVSLYEGTTMDGTQSSNWYGVDWFQIQSKQALAAAVINGSNSNPPLLYSQAGINSLLAVLQQVANNAVSYGCASSCTVSAVPFVAYTTANPANYGAGIYNGFSATLVTQNGFLSLTFNIAAVQFA